LNPREIKERREKGLCFNCDEKFGPGHRCKKIFFIESCWDNEGVDEGESETDEAQKEDTEENLAISLHAMVGTPNPQTMRVKANIDGRVITILIDTGSTHNFLSEHTAVRLKLQPRGAGKFSVTVANGEKIASQGKCPRIRVALQGTTLVADFFLLPLEGFDAVLGAQWLVTLGPILWDFSKMSMKFHLDGREVELKGLDTPINRMIDEEEMEQEIRKEKQGILLQLFALTIEANNSPKAQEVGPGLHEVLTSFHDVFSEPKRLPPPRSHDHQIPLLKRSQPVFVRPYRYPHFQKLEIERIIEEMLESGIIRNSTSPYSSPVILVKKHDGSWRLCIDYRALNQNTVKDKFPIPVIDELLDELHGACCFSKLDLRSGYHQIRMCTEDIPKTAFRTHQGHYEFLVMPFGLTNAPSTFQSLMNEIFKQHLCKFVLVFFDDILVYSKSWEEHWQHVRKVLSILRSHMLYAKKEKCQFGQDHIKYLGHVISTKGVAVDTDKVQAMVDWPKPKTLKALRGFLGLTGYYRKFIQGYGKIAAPLTSLLKKDSFLWNPEAERAFEKLKQVMTQTPVLALPDFTKPFIVECDASGTGIGGVLMQEQNPIAFMSQALHGKNLAMSTYDKEMLALVLAVQKWRPYLMGQQFIVRTDHKSLKYLWEQRIISIAQQRWLTKLMGYDFIIEYKRGNENLVADALS
jgi:hypothetical protein